MFLYAEELTLQLKACLSGVGARIRTQTRGLRTPLCCPLHHTNNLAEDVGIEPTHCRVKAARVPTSPILNCLAGTLRFERSWK